MWTRRGLIAGLGALPIAALAQSSTATPLAAFVAGINGYKRMKRLRNAVADAEAVAAALKRIGYTVTPALDADHAAINTRFEAFCAGLKPDSAVCLYFAGHGLQAAGVNYLLPRDADLSSAETLGVSALRLPEMLARIAVEQPSQCVAILDACRAPPPVAIPASERGFASINAPGGFFVAYAASSGQLALDSLGPDDAVNNSLFTRALVKRLDGTTPIYQLVKDVGEDIFEASLAAGNRQVPCSVDQTRGHVQLDPRRLSSPSPVISSRLGRIANARALVVAVTGVIEPAGKVDFPGARNDAARTAAIFSGLGVDTTVLIDPQSMAFNEAYDRLCAFAGRKLLYFAGPGVLSGGEGYLFVAGSGERPDIRQASDRIALGTLLTRVPARGDTLFILDTGLPQFDLGAEIGSGAPNLSELVRGQWPASPGGKAKFRLTPSVAIFHSAGFYQPAADAAEGAINSPFAIAFANALAGPGLSLAQIAAQLRNDVETMTTGAQTPLFLATPDMRERVLVERA